MADLLGPAYERMKSDRHIYVGIAPTGNATGVSNIFAPQESELEAGGAAGTLNASPSISWNDFDFGIQASETTTDPSLADDSTYEDFGQINYGGGMSFYYPKSYDDSSSNHSLVYDLTDQAWTPIDVIERIDGDISNSVDPEDGDFVHVARTMTDGEANTLTGSDALRRTVNFLPQNGVAVYTVVGAHTITAVAPSTFEDGDKGRIQAIIQDCDVTNMLSFSSSDPDVIQVYPGGFYEVTGEGTATVTIRDEGAGTSTTVTVDSTDDD